MDNVLDRLQDLDNHQSPEPYIDIEKTDPQDGDRENRSHNRYLWGQTLRKKDITLYPSEALDFTRLLVHDLDLTKNRVQIARQIQAKTVKIPEKQFA